MIELTLYCEVSGGDETCISGPNDDSIKYFRMPAGKTLWGTDGSNSLHSSFVAVLSGPDVSLFRLRHLQFMIGLVG